MTTQTQQIRRRTNGTIDIDHYRNRALMERRNAVSAMTGRANVLAFPLIAIVALIAAIVMAPRAPTPPAAAADDAAIAIASR